MVRVNSRISASDLRFVSVALFAVSFVPTSAVPAFAQASGTWTATGTLNFPRVPHTATLLANAQVLVAGGEDTSGNLVASAELYNPATGKWTVTGGLETPRYDHTTTLLADGEVLVAGGVSGTYTASAELYNPSTGRWTATGSMTVPRAFAGAALLANGEVLVAGGSNLDGTSNVTAELYNPVTGIRPVCPPVTNLPQRCCSTARCWFPAVGVCFTTLPPRNGARQDPCITPATPAAQVYCFPAVTC